MTLPNHAQQSAKRLRHEDIPREQSQPRPSASSPCAADTSKHVLEPHRPKPARQLSPAEREDSIQKRQRSAEATVLTSAGAFVGTRSHL